MLGEKVIEIGEAEIVPDGISHHEGGRSHFWYIRIGDYLIDATFPKDGEEPEMLISNREKGEEENMAGHTPFRELTKHWAPERKARIRRQVERELAKMELAELRESLKLTQEDLAARLKVTQVAVSRLEK